MKYILWIFYLISICQALVDVTIDQSVHNSGFHRLVSSNITIYGNLSSCYLAVEERFPKNFVIYSNDLEESNKYESLSRLSTKLDIESSASNGSPFSLYIYLNRSLPVTTNNEFHTSLIYSVLTHVRYHDPKSGGGYREFKKQPAVLFARCPQGSTLPSSTITKFPCDFSSNEICNWYVLPVTHKNLLPQLQIPVGNTDLYQIVFLSTHLSAYMGASYVIHTLISTKLHL